MARLSIEDLSRHTGEEVTLQGWLYNKRSSGKIRFLVMRDGTGLVQGVLVKGTVPDEVFERFDRLTQEPSFTMRGTVRAGRSAPPVDTRWSCPTSRSRAAARRRVVPK